MPNCRVYGVKPLGACLALATLMLLSGCGTMKPRSQVTEQPPIRCEERAPAEEPYPLPSGSTKWKDWRAAALAWVGIATLEVEKRASTAECIERLNEDRK